MDFKDQVKQLADRVSKMKDKILTEEATKNALRLIKAVENYEKIINPPTMLEQ